MAAERGQQFPDELYHASPHDFAEGDIVEPRSSNNKHAKPMAWAGGYDDALDYMDSINTKGSTGSFNETKESGKVYRVEPVNPDEEPYNLGSTYGSVHGYRVVKKTD